MKPEAMRHTVTLTKYRETTKVYLASFPVSQK